MDIEAIVWDLDDDPDGNVQHIAEHGVTKEEVDEVLLNRNSVTFWSSRHRRWNTIGDTSTGKHLLVAWDEVCHDPLTAYPVTAYETP